MGVTQVGINTSFNLIRKVILLAAPFTNGVSLLPYGPIAIIQAAIAIYSTKILGKLAAKEIFIRSKASFIEPSLMIKNLTFSDPEIFNHINIYFSILIRCISFSLVYFSYLSNLGNLESSL